MSLHRHIAVAATLAACGAGLTAAAADGAQARSASHATRKTVVLKLESVKVAIGSTNKSHQVLVSSSGKAVYLLTGDTPSHPKCKTSSCLSAWPAVTTAAKKSALGSGIKGKLGVWHHGRLNQLTLNGHPLYTYASDSRGAALGEGLKSYGGVWELLAASGSPMTTSSKSGSSGGSSGSGY